MKDSESANSRILIDDVVKALGERNTVDAILKRGNFIYSLEKSLDNLQAQVIGLFRNTRLKDYEMVVANDNGWLKTISIGKLGGLHTTHITADQGKLIMFEDGQTLIDMKKNPYRLQELIDEINK